MRHVVYSKVNRYWKKRLDLEKKFAETLSLWNKTNIELSAPPSPFPSPQSPKQLTKEDFLEQITVDKNNRFTIVFFVLNTLNIIENANGYYCYCDEMIICKEWCQKQAMMEIWPLPDL